MVAVLKTVFVLLGERGFESHPLRHNLPQMAILPPSVDNYEETSKKPIAELFLV
jgi:hypothetical protein